MKILHIIILIFLIYSSYGAIEDQEISNNTESFINSSSTSSGFENKTISYSMTARPIKTITIISSITSTFSIKEPTSTNMDKYPSQTPLNSVEVILSSLGGSLLLILTALVVFKLRKKHLGNKQRLEKWKTRNIIQKFPKKDKQSIVMDPSLI